MAHSKLYSISFCNICGLSSNLNSIHQHLQSSSPHALFLTKTKIKPLDLNDNSTLSSQLKCPGYEMFSSFSFHGSVCSFICSDIQSSHLPQLDLLSPGFQLIWLKISLPFQKSFAPYTTRLTQQITNCYLTVYQNQLTQLLLILLALSLSSLVISMSTIQTGLPTLHISLGLLDVMQKPLPL